MPQILLEPLLAQRPDPVFLNLLKQRRDDAISKATPNWNMCVMCLMTAFEAFQTYRVPDWCMFIGPDDYKYFDLDLTGIARPCCKCLQDQSECFQV
jgi:hypothetical protein